MPVDDPALISGKPSFLKVSSSRSLPSFFRRRRRQGRRRRTKPKRPCCSQISTPSFLRHSLPQIPFPPKSPRTFVSPRFQFFKENSSARCSCCQAIFFLDIPSVETTIAKSHSLTRGLCCSVKNAWKISVRVGRGRRIGR